MASQQAACTIVASEKGTLKEADWNVGGFRNLSDLDLDWGKRVVHLSWNNNDENEILVGRTSGAVEVFSLSSNEVLQQGVCSGLTETSVLQGMAPLDRSCVSGFSDGSATCWQWNDRNECEATSTFSTGSSLACIHSNTVHRHEVATGGKQNNLKLWDVERTDKPTFMAKNLRNDTLDLEVPVWVQSIAYPEQSLIATGTAYHEIQLYDPRVKRRPVTRYEFGEHPIVCMDVVPDKSQLIVGNTTGGMALLELRTGTLLGQFRGACGSIRVVQCHKSQPLIMSCCLDRYVRLHHTVTRRLVKEIYAKQRNSYGLLPSSDVISILPNTKRPHAAIAKDKKPGDKPVEAEEEDEDVWDELERVSAENSAATAAAGDSDGAAGDEAMDMEVQISDPSVEAMAVSPPKKMKKKRKKV